MNDRFGKKEIEPEKEKVGATIPDESPINPVVPAKKVPLVITSITIGISTTRRLERDTYLKAKVDYGLAVSVPEDINDEEQDAILAAAHDKLWEEVDKIFENEIAERTAHYKRLGVTVKDTGLGSE